MRSLVHDLKVASGLVDLSYEMAMTLRKIVELGVCTKDGDETCTCKHCHLAKEASVLLKEYARLLNIPEEAIYQEHLD
jgi:hypothetical protein